MGFTMWGHRKALEGGFGVMKYDHDLSIDDRIARNDALNVFESFAGVGGNREVHGGWSQAAHDRGHNTARNEIMFAGNTIPRDDKNRPWADVDLGYKAELAGDIRNFTADDVRAQFGGKTPDVFFASPPCEGHSISARMQGWSDWKGEQAKKDAFNRARNTGDASYFMRPGVGPTPTNDAARSGRDLMNHQLEMFDELQDYRLNNEGRDADDPMYWWLENPRGMMRYQPEMGMRPLIQPRGQRRTGKQAPAASVTHSSYSGAMAEKLGFPRHSMPGHPDIPAMKPTDLWSNAGDIFFPREHTRVGIHENAPELDMSLEELKAKFGPRTKLPKRPAPGKGGGGGVYHQYGPRGARSGTQGVGSYTLPNGLVIPAYHMKSLIPYGLGLDAIVAAELASRGETPRDRLF